ISPGCKQTVNVEATSPPTVHPAALCGGVAALPPVLLAESRVRPPRELIAGPRRGLEDAPGGGLAGAKSQYRIVRLICHCVAYLPKLAGLGVADVPLLLPSVGFGGQLPGPRGREDALG